MCGAARARRDDERVRHACLRRRTCYGVLRDVPACQTLIAPAIFMPCLQRAAPASHDLFDGVIFTTRDMLPLPRYFRDMLMLLF